MAAAEITKEKKIKSDEKVKVITDSASLLSSLSSSSLSLSMASARENISKTDECGRPWSDLLIDMVRIILGKLGLTDRIRARYVCKNWLLLPFNEIPTSSTYEIPWLMSFQNNTTFLNQLSDHCTLYEPLYDTQKPYPRLKVEIQDKKFRYTTISASKNGWVMFYERSRYSIYSFFCYNPFTKNAINLPNLNTDLHGGSTFDLATFSSSPNEDNCVFFLLKKDICSNMLTTYCYSAGGRCCKEEQKWRINQFTDNDGELYNSYERSVYMDGHFYCLSGFGTLASFNVARYEWNYLAKFNLIPSGRNNIVESNGELLLVNEETSYVFDKSSKVWVSMDKGCLKDRAFFLGPHGSFAVSVRDDGDPNRIANKFYNLNYSYNGEDSKNFYGNILEHGWTKTWIQPPSKLQPTTINLKK